MGKRDPAIRPPIGDRIYRLYREEGLSLRKRKARRRAVGMCALILVEAMANTRRSLNLAHRLACGRRLRVLDVVDDVTRECLADTGHLDLRLSHRIVPLSETIIPSLPRRSMRVASALGAVAVICFWAIDTPSVHIKKRPD